MPIDSENINALVEAFGPAPDSTSFDDIVDSRLGERPVTDVYGIGPASAASLEKNGITKAWQLLGPVLYMPKDDAAIERARVLKPAGQTAWLGASTMDGDSALTSPEPLVSDDGTISLGSLAVLAAPVGGRSHKPQGVLLWAEGRSATDTFCETLRKTVGLKYCNGHEESFSPAKDRPALTRKHLAACARKCRQCSTRRRTHRRGRVRKVYDLPRRGG